MSKKVPERTREEVNAFFDSWDAANARMSKEIEKQEKKNKAAEKKKAKK